MSRTPKKRKTTRRAKSSAAPRVKATEPLAPTIIEPDAPPLAPPAEPAIELPPMPAIEPSAKEEGPPPRLTAIIIAHNEEANLPDCLASLTFCDEIIVVDGGSTDATAEIAANAGARVLVQPNFAGFGRQKQVALDAARGEWVLSIDADERIPDGLAREIMSVIASTKHEGYTVNRKTFFLGQFLRYGGWYPDRVLRLARRETAQFSDDPVHERLDVIGSTGDLRNDMLHMSYSTIDDVLIKQRRYAMLSAQVRRERGAKGGLGTAWTRSFFSFIKHYVLQAGCLDGARGYVAARAKAQETFWRYLAAGWEPRDP